MKVTFSFLRILIVTSVCLLQLKANGQQKHTSLHDTIKVIQLNKKAFDNRLINPTQTVKDASTALQISSKINYINGIAEAYRVIGVGKHYLNDREAAIENYLTALTTFRKSKNQTGEAKVYNNIGNLYRDIDNDKSLENFEKSLNIAEDLNDKELVAGLHLNIGTIYLRKELYAKSLSNYQQSRKMFKELNDSVGITHALQNIGVVYFNLNKLNTSEEYLLNAIALAKKLGLNNSISSIDLTLSSLYIGHGDFAKAETSIAEGLYYAKLVKSPKLEYDFYLISYDLESKRKNYEKALHYLQQVYRRDSINYKNNVSDKISLLAAQHRQLETQRLNELTIAKQKYTQVLIWGVSAVAILAFVVIFLLIKNVRRSKHTNLELTRLNQEISKQKDDLDRANHNLEEIIDQRTSDLKIKNKKLSEYSSYLSHQVRSPVATLKGLMLLEKDQLIDQNDLVVQLNECINNLDDKIMNINENLNNPQKAGLISEE